MQMNMYTHTDTEELSYLPWASIQTGKLFQLPMWWKSQTSVSFERQVIPQGVCES